jgi:hypothetical protein
MRLLLNSHPKSGNTYFYTMLMAAARYPNDPNRDGEYTNYPDWIVLSHEPTLLLAKIAGVSQITIVRNPLDTICSNIFRHTSGLSSNRIWGNPGVSKDLLEYDFQDEKFLHALKHSSLKWIEYADNIISNKNELIILSFESITNNTDECIKHILMKNGAKNELLDKITPELVKIYTSDMNKVFSLNPDHRNGTDNRLPLGKNKPKEYYDIRKEIKKSSYYDILMSKYAETKGIAI